MKEPRGAERGAMRSTLLALTAAVALAATGVAALAQSPAQQVRVRGTIVSLERSTLTVTANGSRQTLALTPATRVQYVVPSDFSKIAPGAFIASAAVPQPDGSLRALEVHLFPEGFRPNEGSRPYDLGPQSTMNNAQVGTVDAPVANVETRTLTLKFKDGDKKLVVPKGTPVAAYAPADLKAVVPGAHVFAIAQREPDGSLTAVAVSVGKDGYVPPM